MKLGALVILACALSLSACSSGGAGSISASSQSASPAPTGVQPAPTTITPPPLGARLPATLVGTWSMTIDAADLAVIQRHVPLFDNPGTWNLVLTATTFELEPSSGSGSGSVPVGLSGADQFTLAPDNYCPDQTTQNGGLYGFAIDGKSLTLTPIRDDSCSGRQWLLIAHPWNRKS
jgi:hypothetical protein